MKYINHIFTDTGVRVEFDAHGKNILFYTPDTPIEDLPEQVQEEATELWTEQYVEDWVESQKPTVEQWRQSASLTRRKLMLGIKFYSLGEDTLEDAINTLRVSLDEPMKTVIGISLDESTHFDRNDADLIAMATAIGMTPEQLDEFFVWAENEEWRNL